MKNKISVAVLALFFLILEGSNSQLMAQPNPSPDILLITVDCLRPDHLGCYGYLKNTSPNIDKLAKKGVVFTQAIAQASWTLPSIASISTSTYPSGHKVNFWGVILSPKLPTIAEILRRRGYHNFLCSGHSNPLFEIPGFERGFDEWVDTKKMLDSEEVNALALQFLRENYKRKFFLWIHYMDTHDHFFNPQRDSSGSMNMLQKALNISKYDAAIAQVDKQIGILIDELKELKIDKNTLIIITADHGEEICEHDNCFSHAASLWDSLIRVPLIMVWDGHLPVNKISPMQVQHIDIAPTICDLLKIKKPALFKGQSLLPIVKGLPSPPRAAFSEYHERKGGTRDGAWVYSKYSVRFDNWKLIYTDYAKIPPDYSLYNLDDDPNELKDLNEFSILTKAERIRFESLKGGLEAWSKRKKPNIKSVSKPLDQETRERLKSLGYLH